MKKSIFLFFAAILCAMNVNAWSLMGEVTDWNTGKEMTGDSKVVSVTVNLQANKTLKLKIKNGSTWYGNGGTMSSTNNLAWGFSTSDGDASIKTTDAGDYTFTWYISDKKLSVTYPNHNYIIAGEGDVLEDAWAPGSNKNKMTKQDDGTYSLTKTNRTLQAKTYGYKLTVGSWDVNQYPNNDAQLEVATAGNYDVVFTYNPKTGTLSHELIPVYTVSVSANPAVGGTATGGGSYTKGTNITVTATPNAGYEFVAWKEGENVLANTAEYSFDVTQNTTLVADFELSNPAIPTYVITVSANDAAMGTVTGGGEYTEGSTVTLTASANAGYRFVNWTVGSVEKETATTYSFTASEALTIVANFKEIPTETVYLVNNSDWTKVYAYGWDGTKGETPAWPGAEITANKLAEKYEGYDVYSYKVEEGSYGKVIFNNGSGKQTATFDWENGKYYYAVDPLGSNVFLAGDMNEWNGSADELKKETAEGTTASIKVNLTAKTYEFKLVIDGAWKANTGTMQRGGQSVHEGGWSFDKDGYDDKCKLVADIAGDYIFTWDLTTKKLTVTYPALPKHQVTATVNPAETGEVTGTGEYEQGSEATLIATPTAGYAFKNWTVGGTEESTEATYTFTVSEPISLVANFIPEETHEVTVSYICNSNPIPGHAATTLAVGVTTPSTITAPAITNYTFNGWTLGTGIQTEDDATDNPIHITAKAEGEYTLTANYTKIELTYTVEVPAETEKCFIRGAFDGWDKFHEMTKIDETHYTITIDGATTEHKYKYACQESWDYVELKADGSSVDDRTYNANDVVAKWSTLAKCYLMGNGDWVNGVEMEYDSKNGQYVLLCHHVSAPFKFKIGDEWTDQVENYDFPGIQWADGNIELPEGDYNFYFKKDSKKAYIEVSTPAHERTVPAGYYATVCLSQNIIKVVGATLFEVAGKEGDKVIFDEVLTPVAGIPYIFLAEENTISFYCGIETAATPGDHKSLHGTFEDMVDAELDGMYMVQNNKIVKCAATGCNIPANRAYFNGTELESLGSAPAPMPGRRRITMGAESENTATGVEGIIVTEGQTIKVISNGQLIIIRNGEMYNAQGQKL